MSALVLLSCFPGSASREFWPSLEPSAEWPLPSPEPSPEPSQSPESPASYYSYYSDYWYDATNPPSPPSPPAHPSPPAPPPRPPLHPLHAGEVPAFSRDDIQNEVDTTAVGGLARVYIPPGGRLAFTTPVTCNGNIHLSIRSSGVGATLDGRKGSRMFAIKDGCSLSLETLRFVDGRADYGGAVWAGLDAGDVAMNDVSFTSCEALQARAPHGHPTPSPRPDPDAPLRR